MYNLVSHRYLLLPFGERGEGVKPARNSNAVAGHGDIETHARSLRKVKTLDRIDTQQWMRQRMWCCARSTDPLHFLR